MKQSRDKDPLHGVTLERMVFALVQHYGWDRGFVAMIAAAVVAVVAMWMAPGLVPEQGGSPAVETTIPNAEGADR